MGVGLLGDDVVPPQVAPLGPGDLVLAATDHQHVLHVVGAAIECFVDLRLERADRAAAVAAVGGDDELGVGVGDAVVQGLGREPAEDDAVRGTTLAQASMATTASGIIGK
jgi:hypothetical protein